MRNWWNKFLKLSPMLVTAPKLPNLVHRGPGDDEDTAFRRDAAEAHIKELLRQPSPASGEPGQSDHDRAVSFIDANYDSNADYVDWLKANFADIRREAQQAMAEKAAQVAEQHLRKASSPPMTMDWQRMIDAIRSLAGAEPQPKDKDKL